MKKNLLLAGISIVLGLIMTELALRWTTPFPTTLMKNTIYDEILEYKMNPKAEGIDENGFRNPRALKQAEIIALGDSHTYGYNVESEDSWPQILGRKTNMTVYNFGVGGYGVLQYYHLFNEAIKMNPKHIIVGLFLPNDLRDTCWTLNKVPHWQTWALKNNLKIEPCIENEKRKQLIFQDDLILKFLNTASQSALLSALDHLFNNKLIKKNESSRYRALVYPDLVPRDPIQIKDANNNTKLPYLYINVGTDNIDLNKPHVQSSFQMVKYILNEMKLRCEEANIKFGVLLISSKHSVYYERLKSSGINVPEQFDKTMEIEKKLKNAFIEFFKNNNALYFDSEPYMERAIASQKNVYRNAGDYHPLEPGNAAYANAVYDGLLIN